LAQGGQKTLASLVVGEDVLAVIAAIDDMINLARILDAQRSRYNPILSNAQLCLCQVSKVRTDTCK
jgi:hypothetical protein